MFEKLLLKRILIIVNNAIILPNYKFGFRNSHSTIHQAHIMVDKISFALEETNFTVLMPPLMSPKRLSGCGGET